MITISMQSRQSYNDLEQQHNKTPGDTTMTFWKASQAFQETP